MSGYHFLIILIIVLSPELLWEISKASGSLQYSCPPLLKQNCFTYFLSSVTLQTKDHLPFYPNLNFESELYNLTKVTVRCQSVKCLSHNDPY